jgi:ABC-2 type transport system ATP-binding protein
MPGSQYLTTYPRLDGIKQQRLIMSVAIEARDLVKAYPAPNKNKPGRNKKARISALDGLSLTVPRGAIFALLGPNGAGKTTAVKVLTTLARPDSGGASVEGIDVLASPARARRAIGVVAQRSGADPTATGRENLVLQGHMYGLPTKHAKVRAGELLAHFHLEDAADRFVKTYSGGMQRRLDVALGLVHRPTVLFLDEPTTGLDPESRTAMWREIARLASADSMTVLLTTHYLEEADRLAHRVAIVDDGKIVATGEPGQLKDELKGDVVQVELPARPSERAVRDTLADVPGIRDILVAGDDGGSGRKTYVSARSDDGAAAVPAVLAALAAAGLPAASVTVARPSLDEVYLRYTGRRYSEQAEADAR